jgi:HD-GYP domain-containing protein (c-di-GMP phosphodiesterase class II)
VEINRKKGTVVLESEEILCKRSDDFMTKARAHLMNGALAEASLAIEVARQCAMQTTNLQLQVDAQTRAAIIFDRAQKYTLAFEAIDMAARIAEKANMSRAVRLKVSANRAAFLQDAGFIKQAQIVQIEVIEQTRESTDPAEQSIYLACAVNSVYCALLTNRTREALDRAKAVAARIGDKENALKVDVETRTFFECWFATALSQSGEPRAAAQRLLALREQIPQTNVGLRIQFGVAMGVTEVHSGLVDQGITRLQEITKLAEARGLFYSNALHALTLVYEHIGKIGEALECIATLEKVMNEAARHFVGIEESEEDADTRPQSDSIEFLDEHAADLRVRRFMELAQEERATVFDQIAVASALIDDETGKHCERVEALTYRFAKALGQTDEEAKLLSHAARLHDVGKVGIPHRVLLAPRKLTPMEYEIAKKHTTIGDDLLQFSTHEVVQLARVVALNHHEKWDGTGYPNKLFEDKIPLCARIVALVDVYDVLTNKRVYKRAWGAKEAREELAWGAGKHFDPHLTEVFLKVAVQYEIDTGLH